MARLDDSLEKSALAMANAKLALAEATRELVLAGAHPDEVAAAEEALRTACQEMDYREQEKRRLLGLSDKRGISASERDSVIHESLVSGTKHREVEAMLKHLKNRVREEDRQLVEAQVSIAQAERVTAEEMLEQKILKAPVDGLVAEVFMEVGEAVPLSESKPIFLLAPAGPVDVRVEVDYNHGCSVRMVLSIGLSARSQSYCILDIRFETRQRADSAPLPGPRWKGDVSHEGLPPRVWPGRGAGSFSARPLWRGHWVGAP